MSQSLAACFVHLVFSTKNREPFLADPALRADVHAYLGGIARTLDCAPLRVGGVEDHVHLLVEQARTVCVADLVKEVKRTSTDWMRGKGHRDFRWQTGYGAFSVSKSNLEAVTGYVADQERHHHGAKAVSFQRCRSRTNTARCCASTGWRGMKNSCGIEIGRQRRSATALRS